MPRLIKEKNVARLHSSQIQLQLNILGKYLLQFRAFRQQRPRIPSLTLRNIDHRQEIITAVDNLIPRVDYNRREWFMWIYLAIHLPAEHNRAWTEKWPTNEAFTPTNQRSRSYRSRSLQSSNFFWHKQRIGEHHGEQRPKQYALRAAFLHNYTSDKTVLQARASMANTPTLHQGDFCSQLRLFF